MTYKTQTRSPFPLQGLAAWMQLSVNKALRTFLGCHLEGESLREPAEIGAYTEPAGQA